MSSVNIIKDDYFLTCGLKLEGEIKQSCHDFEVREVHYELRENSPHTKSKSQPSNDTLEGKGNDLEVINLEDTIGSVAIARIANISADYRNTLQSIQDGSEILRSAMMPIVAVLFRSDMNKRQRGLLHEAIKESYPFLKTTAMTAEECLKQSQSYHLSKAYEDDINTHDHSEEGIERSGIEDESDELAHDDRVGCVQEEEEEKEHEKEAAGIWVSADESLLGLASTALSLQDITALYAFKVRGPHHPDAGTGVLVGLGLSRDERTRVYRIVTSKCLSLDSKTVEDRKNKKQKIRGRGALSGGVGSATDDPGAGAGAGDSKSMLIFWRKKASFSKGKSEKDSEIPNSECGPNSSCGLLHLGFTLCKVNTEHLAALQLVAAAACVAISDISFCGIKDKKAVTYQQCVLAIRTYSAVSATREREECSTSCSAIAEECLRSVTDTALRDRAGTAIDSLLAAFPAAHPTDAARERNADSRGYIAVSGMHLALGPFRVGDLWGNRFKITIRRLRFAHIHLPDLGTASPSDPSSSSSSSASFPSSSRPVSVSLSPKKHVEGCVRSIAGTGFPNFFGSQRMGYQESQTLDPERNLVHNGSVCAPLGPSVGKMLLLGRYRDAVDAIILGSVKYEPPLGPETGPGAVMGLGTGTGPLQNARSMYARGVEAGVVLNSMPRAAVKERMLLKAMVRFGWDVDYQSRAAPDTTGVPGIPCRGDTGLGLGIDDSADSNSNSTSNSSSSSNGSSSSNRDSNRSSAEVEGDREKGRERVSKDEEIASRVIAQLPYSTRSLWVSSYQSWLWNNVASHRLMISSTLTGTNPNSGEASNTRTRIQTRTDSSEGREGSGTCAVGCDSSSGGDMASHFSDEDCSAVDDGESSEAMVGDLVHSSSLCSPSLLSLHTDPLQAPDQSNCPSTTISDHGTIHTRHSHTDTFPVPVPPSDNDPVIALTEGHISSLSRAQKSYLFRHSVLLPLFGKKILYPENATGRYYRALLRSEGFGDMTEHRHCLTTTTAAAAPAVSDKVESASAQVSAPLSHPRASAAAESQVESDSRPVVPVPRGAYRKIMQQVSSAHVVDTESIVENGIAPKGGCADSVTVEFTLPAGSYATAYFREIMKNNHFI